MFETKDKKIIDVEELNWDQARPILQSLLPGLTRIIDEISPGPDYVFYKASYPFGAEIIHNEKVYLPLQGGGQISLNNPNLPDTLAEGLNYDPNVTNPLGIVLNRNCEFYLSTATRIMPYLIISPGEMFGLAKVLDNAIQTAAAITTPNSRINCFMWELSAGARSLFMLPKVTDSMCHNKLKKLYGLAMEKPQSYYDHWLIFKDIARKAKANWRAEVLYFSNKWLEKLKDPAWATLYTHLLHIHRSSYRIWHNNSLIWSAAFNEVEQSKYLGDFSYYTLYTARHLFTIAANSAPGFKPATDESSAPIKVIQEAYANGYGLNDHCPTIIEPAQFGIKENRPLYYSLNYPTLAQCNPETFKGRSIIALLDELQRVVGKYQSGIRCHSGIKAPSLHAAASTVEFSYYHSDPGNYPDILDNIVLPNEDPRFSNCEYKGEFPKHSAFLKGCVKISPK